MAEQNQTKPKFRTSIGGQALIEGIMMRGPYRQALPSGIRTARSS